MTVNNKLVITSCYNNNNIDNYYNFVITIIIIILISIVIIIIQQLLKHFKISQTHSILVFSTFEYISSMLSNYLKLFWDKNQEKREPYFKTNKFKKYKFL